MHNQANQADLCKTMYATDPILFQFTVHHDEEGLCKIHPDLFSGFEEKVEQTNQWTKGQTNEAI